jgi:DNA-binding transcriptional LysR family regulator
MMRRNTSSGKSIVVIQTISLSLGIVDLQLAHVKTLEAVARHGSFSRAAAELHLTQPAVSMHVRQLEGRLGLPLLDRVGKRAFPTRAGGVLLAHAARALGELEAGVAMVQRLRGIVCSGKTSRARRPSTRFSRRSAPPLASRRRRAERRAVTTHDRPGTPTSGARLRGHAGWAVARGDGDRNRA